MAPIVAPLLSQRTLKTSPLDQGSASGSQAGRELQRTSSAHLTWSSCIAGHFVHAQGDKQETPRNATDAPSLRIPSGVASGEGHLWGMIMRMSVSVATGAGCAMLAEIAMARVPTGILTGASGAATASSAMRSPRRGATAGARPQEIAGAARCERPIGAPSGANAETDEAAHATTRRGRSIFPGSFVDGDPPALGGDSNSGLTHFRFDLDSHPKGASAT